MQEEIDPLSSEVNKKLLLFDIDGTLMRTAGVGRKSFNLAFRKIFGVKNAFENIEMMGRTDPLITDEALSNHSLDASHDQIERFRNLYYEIFEEMIEEPHAGKRLCPGINVLLNELENDDQYILGILTGNWRYSAYLKLRHFEIDRFFLTGVFADDTPNRDEMIPVALHRMDEEYDINLKSEDIIVIGDTPRDIHAAKPHGAVTIGVATGFHDVDTLKEAKADYVFQDFQNPEDLVNVLKSM